MINFKKYINKFSKAQLISSSIALIAILILTIIIVSVFSNKNMVLLYHNLDLEDSGKIIQELEQKNIPYQLSGNGSIIKVPENLVLSTRVSLASDGILGKGSVIGYEIFDNEEKLGTTNFLQNIKLIRALEGELTRTIESFNNVGKARVHLVIPQREIFSKDKLVPKASIMLQLKNNNKILSKNEVEAIISLVANSVPNLESKHISVIDAKGKALKFIGNEEEFEGSANNDDKKIAVENRIKKTIENLLVSSLGEGSFKAEVRAEMNFDKIVTSSEIYDPDSAVARSSQIIEDKERNSASSLDTDSSVANNVPGNMSEETSDMGGAHEKIDETINYEISKTIKNHIYETGTIKKLSVAILIDGHYEKDLENRSVYKARSEREIKQIQDMVKTIVGFDQERGDKVEIYNMQFYHDNPHYNINEEYQLIKDNLPLIIKTIIFLIIIIFVYYYIKPIIVKLMGSTKVFITNKNNEGKVQSNMNRDKLNEIVGSNPNHSLTTLQKWINQD